MKKHKKSALMVTVFAVASLSMGAWEANAQIISRGAPVLAAGAGTTKGGTGNTGTNTTGTGTTGTGTTGTGTGTGNSGAEACKVLEGRNQGNPKGCFCHYANLPSGAHGVVPLPYGTTGTTGAHPLSDPNLPAPIANDAACSHTYPVSGGFTVNTTP